MVERRRGHLPDRDDVMPGEHFPDSSLLSSRESSDRPYRTSVRPTRLPGSPRCFEIKLMTSRRNPLIPFSRQKRIIA